MFMLPLLFGIAGPANAAWETVPQVTLFADADDNLLLDPDDKESASRMGVDAGVRLSNFTQRGSFYAEPRIVADAYSDPQHEQYETDDVYFDLGGARSWRTVALGFSSLYSEQLLLHSEFVDVVPADPDLPPGENPDPDTGRVETFAQQRELLNLRGNLDVSVSDRNVFRFEVARQDAEYTGVQTSSFYSDYDNTAVALSIQRRIDERNRVSARIAASQYYAVRNDNNSDTIAVEGTFNRSIAQTWSLALSAGVQRSEYDFLQGAQRVQNAATSPRFALGFRKRAERAQWNVDFSHRLQPNGNGFLVVRRDWRMFTTYNFTPRVTGQFGVRLAETHSLDDVNIFDDRDDARLELGVEWAIKPTLFLAFGYDRVGQEFVNEGTGEAVSNVLSVGISYRGRSRQNPSQ